MTNRRPPQQGQACASTCAAAGSISTTEFARPRDCLGAIAAGEQAIVADAMGALGQHVDEKPADELADVERHRRIPAGTLDPVVLDLERDAVLVDRDQTAVRDGDAVGVA